MVSVETLGGFGLPQAVDRTFDRMLDALDAGFRRGWPEQTASQAGASRQAP
jgi:hypothetical protein